MRFISIAILLLFVAAATVTPPDPGEALFNDLCSDCHTLTPPPDLGPPLFDVIERYEEVSGSRKKARAALLVWIADPENTPSAMPDSIREEFGEMPDFGLEEKQVKAVTDWLLRQYDARK